MSGNKRQHNSGIQPQGATDWPARISFRKENAPKPTYPTSKDLESHVDVRFNLRRNIQLQAVLNYGQSHSEPAMVRDLSLGGAFIVMAPVDLREGCYTELILRYRYKGAVKEHHLGAHIARIEPEGVGLRFNQYDDDIYTDLVNLLSII